MRRYFLKCGLAYFYIVFVLGAQFTYLTVEKLLASCPEVSPQVRAQLCQFNLAPFTLTQLLKSITTRSLYNTVHSGSLSLSFQGFEFVYRSLTFVARAELEYHVDLKHSMRLQSKPRFCALSQ